jgi:hypothetical protein
MALQNFVAAFLKASTAAAAVVALGGPFRTGSDPATATAAELTAGTLGSTRFVTPLLLSGMVNAAGTTAARPTTAPVGYSYFDTTLGKPVFLKTTPSTWVDSTGTAA